MSKKIQNNLQRDLYVLEDENNPSGSKINKVWATTILDQVFDNQSPTNKTLREIIADLHTEIITGGRGNIVFPVTSVNGMNNDVVITPRNIGLGNVDNTPDIDKPLSGPQRESIMEILRHYDFNVDLRQLYDHIGNHDNPHGVTVDQLNSDNRLSNLIQRHISEHNQSTKSNVHADIRRLINELSDRINAINDDIQRDVSSTSNMLENHISDKNSHKDQFDLKENISNKVFNFSTTTNKDYIKYPSTKAVVDFVTDQIKKYNDTLPDLKDWIDDVIVVDTRKDLPTLSPATHRKMYIIRRGNDSHSEIAICRMNQDDETYSWDISSLGSYTKFDSKYFTDSINGMTLNVRPIMDDIISENGMLDTSLSNILSNYYQKNEIDDRHYIRSISIVPGTMDGHIRYYINDDLTTMSNDIKVPGLKRLAYLEWITENELFDQSVHERHILTQAITTRHLQDRSVTGRKIFTSSEGNVFLGVREPNTDPVYMKFTMDIIDDNSLPLSKLKVSSIGNRVVGVRAAGKAPEYLQINHDMLETNIVDTDNIISGSVTSDKLRDKSVMNQKIADNAVNNRVISDNSITTQKVTDKAVTSNKLADAAVSERSLQSDSVTTTKIKDNSVSTAKLQNSSVTTDKIANGAVTNQKIGTGSISTDKVQNKSITAEKLADNSVTTVKIVDGSITSNKLAPGAVTFDDIAPNGIDTDKIKDSAVTGDKIASNSIERDHIKNQSITASKIECTWDHVIGNIDNKGSKIAHEITIEDLANSLKRFIKEGSSGDNNQNTSNGNGVSTNTWIPNTEYSYPDKTYGRRLKGTITATKNTVKHTLITSRINLRLYSLLDAGGSWEYKVNNSGWTTLAGSVLGGTVGACIRMEMDGLYLDTISTEDRIDAKYDIWIRYSRNDEIPPIIDPDGNIVESDEVCDLLCEELTAEEIRQIFNGTYNIEDNPNDYKNTICQPLSADDMSSIWNGTYVDTSNDDTMCRMCDEITANEIRVLFGLDPLPDKENTEPYCPYDCNKEISASDVRKIYRGELDPEPDTDDYTNTVCAPISNDTITAIWNDTYGPIDQSEYEDGYNECRGVSTADIIAIYNDDTIDYDCDDECEDANLDDILAMWNGTYNKPDDEYDQYTICQPISADDINSIYNGTYQGSYQDDDGDTNCEFISNEDITRIWNGENVEAVSLSEDSCSGNCAECKLHK